MNLDQETQSHQEEGSINIYLIDLGNFLGIYPAPGIVNTILYASNGS